MQILSDPQAFWDSIDGEDSPHWPVICVDFNGVLDQHKGWNGQVEYTPPADGAKEFLTALSKTFNTIVIFTATIPIYGVADWFIRYDMDHLVQYVSNWKVPAAVYVDDKAVTHKGNFGETLDAVMEFSPWWLRPVETLEQKVQREFEYIMRELNELDYFEEVEDRYRLMGKRDALEFVLKEMKNGKRNMGVSHRGLSAERSSLVDDTGTSG